MTTRIFRALLLGTVVLAAAPALAQSGASGGATKPEAAAAGTIGAPDAAQTLGRIGAANSASPDADLSQNQDAGPFPTNRITNAPYIAPNDGEAGLKASVQALQTTLTQLQQLKLQTKQAHWNLSGPFFYALHEQLQEQFEAWEKDSDMVAERMLAIGASADGRATTVVRTSSLPEIPGGFVDDARAVRWFTLAYKTVGEEVRGAVKATAEVDPETSNILQEVEGHLGKYQWMMRAYVQQTATDGTNGDILNGGRAIDVPSQPQPEALGGANGGNGAKPSGNN